MREAPPLALSVKGHGPLDPVPFPLSREAGEGRGGGKPSPAPGEGGAVGAG